MTRIKLLTTGGTIASQPTPFGLEPTLNSEGILRYLDEITDRVEFDHQNLFSMDSSNIQPEEWQLMAREAYRALPHCDGVLITHGTDTMSYTAAALSFMLQGLDKPVVLTGSQIPIDQPLTDARTNLYTAVAGVQAGLKGVLVAFDRKIMNGARTVKTSTMGFDAFTSVNAADMARVYADGLRILSPATSPPQPRPILRDNLCTDVFLLKLIPGTSPRIFETLANLDYRGVVIEAFGAGGMHYLNRDLLGELELLCRRGVTVVICSQCLFERSDLSIYEVGQRLLATGAISALDMTTEASVTKLMWVLGQTHKPEEIARLFCKNLAGEIES